jgi:hypothetical protein
MKEFWSAHKAAAMDVATAFVMFGVFLLILAIIRF